MSNGKLFFIVCLVLNILFSKKLNAQDYKNPDVCKTEVIHFKHHFYLISYKEESSSLSLLVEQLNENLSKTKEYTLSLGNAKCAGFYAPQVDTIHNYINISLQQLDNDKTIRVVRLNSKLDLVVDLPNSDITRVNTFTAFETEYLYSGKNLYVVRPLSKDSAHKYILQQYTLKDETKLFEYNAGWQLNFAKQSYHRCYIIAANETFVYVFANVMDGTKKGQWLLFIDPIKGEILHSERLNDENEGFTFLYGNHAYNAETKDLAVVGYKLNAKQVSADYSKVDLTIGKTKLFPVFVCTFDSSGFVKERTDNFIPVPVDVEREKDFKQYLCKIIKMEYKNNQYTFVSEIMGAAAAAKEFKTYGYTFSMLEHNEEGILKPKFAQFNCTYRDSKNKEAKNIFSQHAYLGKQDADELFYKKAIVSVSSGFAWNLPFGAEKVVGYSTITTKSKKTLVYKYTYENLKWTNAEFLNTEPLPAFKLFNVSIDKANLFNAEKMDEGLKFNLGVVGGMK